MDAADKPTARPRWSFLRMQETGLMLVILVFALILGICGGTAKRPVFQTNADGEIERVFVKGPDGELQPAIREVNKFFNADNLVQMAKDTSFIAIMAVGATFIIIAGGIDLSVGAIYALAAVVGAMVFQSVGPEGSLHESVSPGAAVCLGILACLGTATLCGLVNGGMTVLLRVHPFIITLGTMAIFRGVAYVLTQGTSITNFPEAFRDMIQWEVGYGLSVVPLMVMVLITVAGGLYLARLAAGRRIYAIGGNETASRFSGIRVNWVRLSVFVIAGFTAGIAALLALGYYGAATSGDGQGYELKVIAAAVVGGASLTGGRGSALGAMLGALLIQMIDSGIVILEIDQNYSQIIIGSVVIVAVVLDQLNAYLSRRRLAWQPAK